MTTKPKTENITLLPYAERVKLVRERLAGLRRCETTPLPKPAKVEAAEALYREWERRAEAHDNEQRAAHRAKLNEISDALIVGDIPKAVALMQKLGA
jgi:hypothetical protein